MYNDELEKAMLYFIIFEKAEFELSENDFVSLMNKKIIRVINKLKLSKKEVSMLSVSEQIKDEKNILEYLSELNTYTIGSTAENIYEKIKDLTKKRDVFLLAKEITKDTKETENIDLLIEKAISKLQKIEMQTEKQENFVNLIARTTDLIEQSIKKKDDLSYYTGFFELDALTDGLHKGELTIIGARPATGKTTFALQIAERIAGYNKSVMFVSLEMSEEQIIQKILAKKSRVNSRKIRNGDLTEEELDNIYIKCGEISDLPLLLYTKLKSIQQIEIEARKLKNKGKIDLLIIDYLQLVRNMGNFKSREQEVADISRTLKLLSLELEIPIIALCQLNRNASKNEPTLADIRESGSIEQDADNVIFLYQEDAEDNKVTIDLQKQRAGNIGKLKLKFNKILSEFVNLER